MQLLTGKMAGGVRSGRWTTRELVATSLERIGRPNPGLNAFTAVRTKEALVETDRLNAEPAGEVKGRKAPGADSRLTVNTGRFLTDTPIAMKEEFDVIGLSTALGSSKNPSPAAVDGEVIHHMRTADAIAVGEATTPEFGRYFETISDRYGATPNPWRHGFSPGGSSGGLTVAVAAGMTPVILGADDGGSTYLPAACCGILGLKPERDRVTMAPLSQHRYALVTFSGLSRTAVDSVLLYDTITSSLFSDRRQAEPLSESYRDAVIRGTGSSRIAWTGRSPMSGLKNDPEVDRALTALIQRLTRLGHDVRKTHTAWPVSTDAFTLQSSPGTVTEVGSVEAPEKLERHTRRITTVDRLIPTYLAEFVKRRGEKIAWVFNERFFPATDVLAMPTIPILPRPLGWLKNRSTSASIFRDTSIVISTSIFNATGHPTLSIPGGVSMGGLPIGMQFVTRFDCEDLLLVLAAQLEKDKPWPTPPGFWPRLSREIFSFLSLSWPYGKTAFRSTGKYQTPVLPRLPIPANRGRRSGRNSACTLHRRSADNFPE